MANFSESPQGWYSTMHAMTTCEGGVGVTEPETLLFGFPAVGMRIVNSCNDPVYFNLQTSASTADNYVAGCSELLLNPMPPFAGYSLKTTSTSTGAGLPTARPQVRIIAWGKSA